MKLRSLTLTNVRKFAGRTATISGIGDGVSVIAEVNEFGKSTFFDALHALFFFKYGAATRDVKSLQPRAGGAVRISAEVELPQGHFTIEKSYLAQKRAQVRDAAGRVIASDDEAEAWIAKLTGSGLEGPAGLLWVGQGSGALDAATAPKTEKERLLGARRDLLSSVAGEIDKVTGGRRMDRVIEAARAAHDTLATDTGRPKTGGPWKDAETEAQTHAARHADLERACAELSIALARRREVTARLGALEAPAATEALEAKLHAARQAHDAAKAHADRLAQAEGQAALRKLEADAAQSRLDALLGAAQSHAAAEERLEVEMGVFAQAQDRVTQAETETDAALERLAEAKKRTATARAALGARQRAALARNASETAARLKGLLDQLAEKRSALEEARAQVAASPVTREILAGIEAAQGRVAKAQAESVAASVRIELRYSGGARVTAKGAELAEGSHAVPRRQVFALPGIGEMIVDPGAAASDGAALDRASAALEQALAAAGVADLPAARRAAEVRAQAQTQADLLQSVIETLAPQGIDALRAEHARAQAAVGEQANAPEGAEGDDDLAAALSAAEAQERHAQAACDLARDARDAARSALARATATAEAARTAKEAAAAAYGDAQDFETRRTQAARAHAAAAVAATDAQASAAALRAQAPDLESAQAELARASTVAQNARDERAQLGREAADLSATIRARAEDGVEEKCSEAADLAARAQARAARFAHEVAGLRLLLETLQKTRGAAQEAYFEPVQRELAPLLALLHGDAALSFDPASLLPQGLARGGTDEPVDMLSGGTQEQIAILTRLAFARLFARQGRQVPVILDDALVYSDDHRIAAMFTALHRVAADQQVIVFSCRQMAFADLGGTRPRITVTEG